VPDLVGHSGRAIVASIIFTFARLGAMVAMTIGGDYAQRKRYRLRLHDERGKQNDVAAHHTLEEYPNAYLKAAGIADDWKRPPFRAAPETTAAPNR
jgi:hypothetical protein